MEKQNRYRVIVSERATQMLAFHAAFLAQTSPKAAEKLTAEKLTETTEQPERKSSFKYRWRFFLHQKGVAPSLLLLWFCSIP